jgi:hypothetical protein
MTRVVVDIPEGVSNNFTVAHYTMETTDNNWGMYLNMKSESSDTPYTVLLKDGCPMPIMQDSHAEYKEHQWLWDNATGDVLVGGLGIGMLHQKLIDNPNVTSVTIIELEQDVVDLVWEHCIKDDSFTLVVADFETWNPPEGSSFDTVWGDTWLVDNSLTMKDYSTLIRDRYSQYTPNIGFWGE